MRAPLRCPTCRLQLAPRARAIRARALETLLARKPLPCRFAELGCGFVGARAARDAHEAASCPCDPSRRACPIAGCTSRIPPRGVAAHLRADHGIEVHRPSVDADGRAILCLGPLPDTCEPARGRDKTARRRRVFVFPPPSRGAAAGAHDVYALFARARGPTVSLALCQLFDERAPDSARDAPPPPPPPPEPYSQQPPPPSSPPPPMPPPPPPIPPLPPPPNNLLRLSLPLERGEYVVDVPAWRLAGVTLHQRRFWRTDGDDIALSLPRAMLAQNPHLHVALTPLTPLRGGQSRAVEYADEFGLYAWADGDDASAAARSRDGDDDEFDVEDDDVVDEFVDDDSDDNISSVSSASLPSIDGSHAAEDEYSEYASSVAGVREHPERSGDRSASFEPLIHRYGQDSDGDDDDDAGSGGGAEADDEEALAMVRGMHRSPSRADLLSRRRRASNSAAIGAGRRAARRFDMSMARRYQQARLPQGTGGTGWRVHLPQHAARRLSNGRRLRRRSTGASRREGYYE